MIHHPDVVAVISAHRFQAVAEPLTPREMLFEVGEAAIHRVTPRVDDLRVRQDQVDEACVHPVVGHLVDEIGLVRFPLDTGAVKE